MRGVSYLQGPEELEKVKSYTMNFLSPEEKTAVRKMEQKIEAYISEESDDFLTFKEIVKLRCLWLKYQHLKPFEFHFNPREKIPEVYRNRTAFIIWTVWRSFHLLGEEDLERAALAAANVLSHSPPYPEKVKEKAILVFAEVMEATGYRCPDDLSRSSFWEEKIFPYLEGVWEFKYRKI